MDRPYTIEITNSEIIINIDPSIVKKPGKAKVLKLALVFDRAGKFQYMKVYTERTYKVVWGTRVTYQTKRTWHGYTDPNWVSQTLKIWGVMNYWNQIVADVKEKAGVVIQLVPKKTFKDEKHLGPGTKKYANDIYQIYIRTNPVVGPVAWIVFNPNVLPSGYKSFSMGIALNDRKIFRMDWKDNNNASHGDFAVYHNQERAKSKLMDLGLAKYFKHIKEKIAEIFHVDIPWVIPPDYNYVDITEPEQYPNEGSTTGGTSGESTTTVQQPEDEFTSWEEFQEWVKNYIKQWQEQTQQPVLITEPTKQKTNTWLWIIAGALILLLIIKK